MMPELVGGPGGNAWLSDGPMIPALLSGAGKHVGAGVAPVVTLWVVVDELVPGGFASARGEDASVSAASAMMRIMTILLTVPAS